MMRLPTVWSSAFQHAGVANSDEQISTSATKRKKYSNISDTLSTSDPLADLWSAQYQFTVSHTAEQWAS